MPPGRFSNSGTPGAPLQCNAGTVRRSERCGVNSAAIDPALESGGCWGSTLDLKTLPAAFCRNFFRRRARDRGLRPRQSVRPFSRSASCRGLDLVVFFSAVRRCPVWLRLLLYAAEVALKLQFSPTSNGSFFQGRFGEAESVPAGVCVGGEGFCTVIVAPTTCRFTTCVLTTCIGDPFQRRIGAKGDPFQREVYAYR